MLELSALSSKTAQPATSEQLSGFGRLEQNITVCNALPPLEIYKGKFQSFVLWSLGFRNTIFHVPRESSLK